MSHTNTVGLTPLNLLAISKAFNEDAAKEARAKVPSGAIYPVDLTLRLYGNLSIGEDSKATPTSRLPYKALLGLFIKKLPSNYRDKVAGVLLECMRDAVANGPAAKELVPEVEECELLMDRLMSQLDKVPRFGNVTPNLNVEVFEER